MANARQPRVAQRTRASTRKSKKTSAAPAKGGRKRGSGGDAARVRGRDDSLIDELCAPGFIRFEGQGSDVAKLHKLVRFALPALDELQRVAWNGSVRGQSQDVRTLTALARLHAIRQEVAALDARCLTAFLGLAAGYTLPGFAHTRFTSAHAALALNDGLLSAVIHSVFQVAAHPDFARVGVRPKCWFFASDGLPDDRRAFLLAVAAQPAAVRAWLRRNLPSLGLDSLRAALPNEMAAAERSAKTMPKGASTPAARLRPPTSIAEHMVAELAREPARTWEALAERVRKRSGKGSDDFVRGKGAKMTAQGWLDEDERGRFATAAGVAAFVALGVDVNPRA